MPRGQGPHLNCSIASTQHGEEQTGEQSDGWRDSLFAPRRYSRMRGQRQKWAALEPITYRGGSWGKNSTGMEAEEEASI